MNEEQKTRETQMNDPVDEQQQTIEEEILTNNSQENSVQEPNQEEAAAEKTNSVDLTKLLTGLKNEYDREKAVAAEYLRRLQQLQAEYDNFRKRTQREKEDLAKYATEKLIAELLPVLDNFERGLTASKHSQDFDSLVKGVEMVQRQLSGALEKEGLTPIIAAGQEFDPNLHEAVMHLDSDEHESNMVIDELQKGYYLKDKVIRPSMVRVCK